MGDPITTGLAIGVGGQVVGGMLKKKPKMQQTKGSFAPVTYHDPVTGEKKTMYRVLDAPQSYMDNGAGSFQNILGDAISGGADLYTTSQFMKKYGSSTKPKTYDV